jgi:primosomal protein N' (replication factor Y)
VRLVFRGQDESEVLRAAEQVRACIQEQSPPLLSLLGPSLCPISKIKRNYRAHLIIKIKRVNPLQPTLLRCRQLMRGQRGVYLEIDVDPMSML